MFLNLYQSGVERKSVKSSKRKHSVPVEIALAPANKVKKISVNGFAINVEKNEKPNFEDEIPDKTNSAEISLSNLPDIPLEMIVRNLPHKDLCNLALTSKIEDF